MYLYYECNPTFQQSAFNLRISPKSWKPYASKDPWCFANNANASSLNPAFANTVPQSSWTVKLSPCSCASACAACTASSLSHGSCEYSASALTAAKSGTLSCPLISERTSENWPSASLARSLSTRARSSFEEEKADVSKEMTLSYCPAWNPLWMFTSSRNYVVSIKLGEWYGRELYLLPQNKGPYLYEGPPQKWYEAREVLLDSADDSLWPADYSRGVPDGRCRRHEMVSDNKILACLLRILEEWPPSCLFTPINILIS